VQHRERRRDVLRLDPAAADVLRRARHRCVARIEVHLERIGNVPRHHGALEEVNVVHDVDDPPDVVQVLDGRFPVTRARIDDVHHRAGGAEVRPLAPGLEVVPGILRVQDEVAARLGQRVFDERGGEQQAAVLAHGAARLRQELDAGVRRIGQPDLRQQAQCGAMNLRDVAVVQGPIAAARHAGPDRPEVVRQRAGALGPAGVASGHTSCRNRVVSHVPLPRFLEPCRHRLTRMRQLASHSCTGGHGRDYRVTTSGQGFQ
jgi:hypothetical protein